MFFILSKTLNYLTMPLVIICSLLLAAFFIRSAKWKTRLFRAGVVLLLFFSNDFIANELIRAWEVPVTPFADMKKKYEWGIILCGVTKSETGPKDRVYFSMGADRVTHTLQLYRLGIIQKILISGGSGRLIDIGQREADELASVLKLMGVKDEDILTENDSRNTHESAVAIKKILEKITTPEDCLLITSSFHMRRSAACMAREGWKSDTFSTDFFAHPLRFSVDTLIVPQLQAIYIWHLLTKETVGYVSYKLVGYI